MSDDFNANITFSEEQILKAQSENLASYVVLYRTLGIAKENAIKCMEELARRRANGDLFEYESFIEEKSKEIPKPKNTDFDKLFMTVRYGAKEAGNLINSLRAKIQK